MSACLNQDRSHTGLLRSQSRGRPARALRQQCHCEEDDAANGGNQSEPGMDEEADGQEDRNPREINNRNRAGAGQKRPDLVEVGTGCDPAPGCRFAIARRMSAPWTVSASR